MNRRNFLTMLTNASSERVSAETTSETFDENDSPQKSTRKVQSGLEPYTRPLTRPQVLHLTRRAGFSATNAQITQLVGKTAQEAVSTLFGTTDAPLPAAPGAWVNDLTENPDRADNDTRNQIIGRWGGQFGGLQSWWVNLMLSEGFPMREKMVLFWSGHFTSEFAFDDVYNPPQLLYRQNQLLRQDAFGDVRKLAEDITLDGAMLNYLGGTLNSKGAPNENYARELFELFTTGLGQYTEGDIKEAARLLTGWRCSRFNDEPRPNGAYNSYFVPTAHDTGAKQVLGVSVAAREADANTEFLVRQGEVRRLVDIIFQERADAAARFLSAKIYRFFVYANPTTNSAANAVITQMAGVLRTNTFRIRPLLQTLFSSAHFFDEANIGVQVKTPAEFVVGLARQLGVSAGAAVGVMNSLEQTLLDPPNVAGWDGYRTWLSTKTFPLRVQYAQQLVQGMSNEAAQGFARQFAGAGNVQTLVQGIMEFLLPKPISQKRLQSYVATLLQGAPDYEWSSILNNATSAGPRIKSLLTALAKAPDMQLC